MFSGEYLIWRKEKKTHGFKSDKWKGCKAKQSLKCLFRLNMHYNGKE